MVVIRKAPKFPVVGLNAKEPVAVAPSLNATPVSVKSIGTARLDRAKPRLVKIVRDTIIAAAPRPTLGNDRSLRCVFTVGFIFILALLSSFSSRRPPR